MQQLRTPWVLEAGMQKRDLTTDEMAKVVLHGNVVLMEAILRLAREVDDLKGAS